MRCLECQHENASDAKFCNQCGSPFAPVCSACGRENAADAKFCNQCGIALTSAPSSVPSLHQETDSENATQETSSTQSEPRPRDLQAPDAERRQLTVMFCDLVGSTSLSGRMDAEDYRVVVRDYQKTCTEVIKRFDGYVAQYLGDGLLIYFGYPQSHEDEAQRAVYSGLGILAAMTQLNARLKQDKDIYLSLRVGIHTGLVVIGEIGEGPRQEHLALGEVPNIAARIQGLAEPDKVVISDATYRLIQGYFECQELGEQHLRGVSQPINVYRVFGVSGVQSRLDIASTQGLTPLVGRESEVTLLLERWSQVRDGQGQVVLLSGEAGIGKSRLVQDLKDHIADEPHAQEESRCSPYHINSAFYPLADLLQRKLGWQTEDTADEKLHKLETVLAQTHLDVSQAVPLFTTLLSLPLPDDRYPTIQLSSQQQRQHTLEAFLQLILLAAEQHPVLFIVEDLHWVDPSTLEFLELLIDQTPTTAILVLLTGRPEFQPTWSHRSYLTDISLNRLSRPQIEQIATQVASGQALPADVIELLVDKTDGVPLYVEEMTKSVLESGVLKKVDGRYELTGPLSALSIPTTLQDSLMSRLDRLVTAKVIAQLGATIGRQFDYGLLHAVSELDGPTLQRELGRLVDAELIYPRGLPPQATYIFKHALIQDTAYQSLLRSTRQEYHQRIANVLEAQFADIEQTSPELMAHHCIEAGLNEQAVGYCHQAGQNAMQRSAYLEATSHLSKGIELLQTLPKTPDRTQQELTVYTALGSALVVTKGQGAHEVREVYDRARELCQQVGDTSQLFPVLYGLWSYYLQQEEAQTAQELAEQLLTHAENQRDPTLLIEAHRAQVSTWFWCGEFTRAHAHCEQGIALYTRQQHRAHAVVSGGTPRAAVVCQSLSTGAWALWYLGYPDQALQRSQEALTLARELAHPHTLTRVLELTSWTHIYRREGQPAYELADEAIALATTQEFPHWIAMGTVMRGWALAELGQWETGRAQMRQGIDSYWATGAVLARGCWLAQVAEAYGREDQPEEGLRVLGEALALVNDTGMCHYEAEMHRLKGELLLSQSKDNYTEAEPCFHQALEVSRHQEAKSLELRAATSLARFWQSQGKPDKAHELLGPVYSWFTEGFDTADLQDAKALLNELEG